MTEASRYLVALAERIAERYVAATGLRAILLTGSAAEGVSDFYSDLDLIVYHDGLPTDDQLAAARGPLVAAGTDATVPREADSAMEFVVIQGVDCQIAQLTIASWEREMASVFGRVRPGHPNPKGHHGPAGRRRPPRR